jgi:arylsulfatase A-like enzyme
MNRRTFLKFSGIFTAGLSTSFFVKELFAQKTFPNPNIVLLVADDLGWNDIGYHNDKIKSPVLDNLAATGVELAQHYVQPQCTPTRVALMTGRYPSRFGHHCTQASNEHSYPFETLTIASMLKKLGYTTGLFGKWHMGSRPEWGPNHHGFDYSYGSLAGAVGMYDHRYRLSSPYKNTWHRNHEFTEEQGHATDLVTKEAVNWIEANREKNFFCYVPFHSVHTPLVEEDKWLQMNKHIESPGRRLMAAAISHLDHCIGQIINALDRNNLRENTLIIFISDNGGIHTGYAGGNYPPPDPKLEKGFSSNLPLKGGKTTVYEGGIRVPAFVNWKGSLKPCKVTVTTHCVDWMPTLANFLDTRQEKEPDWDGMNIWPFITRQKQTLPDRQIYWLWGRERNRVALRKGDWKLLRNNQIKWQLYNIADDPYEKNDLSTQKLEMLEQLKDLINKEKQKDKI